MSPPPLPKVSPAARFQAPLTLSDTETVPLALYWANQPTSRSPWATGLVRVIVVEVTALPVTAAPAWTKAAWPPLAVGVVTEAAVDGAEWLPAASKASTV